MTDLLDYYQPWKISFATRLKQKLTEQGYVSRRQVDKANGATLAAAVGVSLPMARRYINAQSIPSGVILKKIADLLNIDPLWLLYGDNDTHNTHLIDGKIFEEIFMQLFDRLCTKTITKEEYMKIIQSVIEIYHQVVNLDPKQPKSNAISLMISLLLR